MVNTMEGITDKITTALPAMQIAAVVISYVFEIIEKLIKTMSFATGITKVY